eukprot:402016-Pleurochrysis_carterae.AAC.1
MVGEACSNCFMETKDSAEQMRIDRTEGGQLWGLRHVLCRVNGLSPAHNCLSIVTGSELVMAI